MPLPPLVEPAPELTRQEVMRYSRHLIIPDVAMDGQKRLKNARVLAVGAGGLGSPTLMYLAAAGVGTLGIIDFDVVDEDFVAAVENGALSATQFHPEKSGDAGAALLANWVGSLRP